MRSLLDNLAEAAREHSFPHLLVARRRCEARVIELYPTVLRDLSVHGNSKGARQVSGQTTHRAASTMNQADLGAGSVLCLARFIGQGARSA